MQRLGLLTLAGLGVTKDPAEAATLCAQAHLHDASVPAGFCLAAAAAELSRVSGPTAGTPGASVGTASASVLPSVMAGLQDLSNHGNRAATAELCWSYFAGRNGTFDTVLTADWCRRAAEYGSAQAMRRIGLMHLWGVGVERSLPEAEALCAEAERRDRTVSAAFCLAAVEAEHKRTAEMFSPSHFVYPEPWPAASDPALSADALAPDRALETLHTTPTGLRYTCRDLIRWSRYGQVIDPAAFGRPIETFTDRDYASLGEGATACAAAIAPYDQDGSERSLLAQFGRMLPTLKAQQAQLARATQARRVEEATLDRENRDLAAGRTVVAVPGLSSMEQACTNSIQRVWAAGSSRATAGALEIRSATTRDVQGHSVVSGTASVLRSGEDRQTTPYSFTCTFAGHSQAIVGRTLQPAAAAAVGAAAR